jgi:hypothetical protein
MSFNLQSERGNNRIYYQLRLLVTVIGFSAVLILLYLIGQL